MRRPAQLHVVARIVHVRRMLCVRVPVRALRPAQAVWRAGKAASQRRPS